MDEPGRAQVREFLIDITLETVERYDLDGIQFDDRLSWPRKFGWDTTTAAIYQQETGRSLPSNINDTRFREWRQSKVTLFAEELTAAVEAVRPDLLLSVSPSVTNFSDVNFNAEWPEWQDNGLFDEYAVQVYRDNFNSFNSTLNGQIGEFLSPDERDQFIVGLRGNGTGANTPYADLENMIIRSRQINAAGHSIFYSRFVREEFDDELTTFYDVAGEGHAVNPLFGPNHRPSPIVATQVAADTWSVDIAEDFGYRLIAEIGGDWHELSAGFFPAGERKLTVFGATRVELLADRRPIDAADFNGDGLVNAVDYALWRDLSDAGANVLADANDDGLVNQLDYDLWSGGYAFLAGSSSSIPEPSATTLATLTLSALSGITKERRNQGR